MTDREYAERIVEKGGTMSDNWQIALHFVVAIVVVILVAPWLSTIFGWILEPTVGRYWMWALCVQEPTSILCQ